MRKHYKRVECADGFSLSVQVGDGIYSEPRLNGCEAYSEVEIGFPTEREDLIIGWAEDRDRPTQTVYGYVPSQILLAVISKHGGMVGGELPPLTPSLDHF